VTIGSISLQHEGASIFAIRTYTHSVRQSTQHRRRSLFEDALIVIRRDFGDEDLSLAAVAHRIATSRRQLQRVFAEQGTSFRRELQRARMAHAAMLLRQQALPVAAVARAVGYRQAAQFSKAFRRHHGHPPSEARTGRPQAQPAERSPLAA
jgi:AraC family transcriptional regulator, regulatory protein of adaptative response / methylphosphotriester-DNA alkyltransferase methyltransferase